METRRIFGPTYETRNQQFEMDPAMFDILQLYAITDPSKAWTAFREGLRAGRITQKDQLPPPRG